MWWFNNKRFAAAGVAMVLFCLKMYCETEALSKRHPIKPAAESTTTPIHWRQVTENFTSIKTHNNSVVLIFPFRKRHNHYAKHMAHLQQRLRSFKLNVHIYVIEQNNNDPFQRSWLLNVGIAEATKTYPDATCIVTHDVDFLVEVASNYAWCDRPTQVCSEISCFNNNVPYNMYSGGVVQASPRDWKTVNGFTNKAVGWGGEDDDLYHRFRMTKLLEKSSKALRRPPAGKGKCRCLHDADHTERVVDKDKYRQIVAQINRMSRGSTEWKTDGLNSLVYSIDAQYVDTHGTHWLKASDTRTATLTINPVGRLGNLMFEYASAYGIAEQASVSFCLGQQKGGFSFNALREAFVGPFASDCQRRAERTIKETGYALHDASLVSRVQKIATFVEVTTYLQSQKYFVQIAPKIKELFKFKPMILKEAQYVLAGLRKNKRGIVGIHVRRGDYVAYGYVNFPPTSYFKKAMAQFPNHRFVVVSTDVKWCRVQPFFANNDDVIVLPGDRAGAVDMAILSLCDGIILTVGTFGWWAAWLAKDARVVYYDNVFKLDHPTNKGKVRYEDHFLPEWSAVSTGIVEVNALSRIMKKGQWEGSPIVLRKFKLIFWSIPKNSCEEFKRLFRRMEGFKDWKIRYNNPRGYAHAGPASTLPHDPSQNGLTYLYDLDAVEATAILNDKTWTKAFFWRDPMERFVSAYLDKIVNHPYHNKKLNWDFKTFVAKVEAGMRDVHWNPQCDLYDCNKWMPIISFWGHIKTIAKDTERLLRQIGAWEEFGANGWGTDGLSSIFRGKKHAAHTTGAHARARNFYSDKALRHRVEVLMAKDLKQHAALINKRLVGCSALASLQFVPALPIRPDGVKTTHCPKWNYNFTFPRGNRCGYGYEASLYESPLTSCSTIIDIGANWGQSTLPLLQMGWRVIAFEPLPSTAGYAAFNIAQNKILNSRGVVIPAAASNVTGQTWINLPSRDDNAALASAAAIANVGGVSQLVEIRTIRVDDYIETLQNISEIRIVKLDTQGHELPALQGMTHLLRTQRPMLIVERDLKLQAAAGFKTNDVHAFLKRLDYRAHCLREGHIKQEDPPQCYNVIYLTT